jgi:hypothetical protein
LELNLDPGIVAVDPRLPDGQIKPTRNLMNKY